MAMKKEALTNFIADDLTKRNENWTEIDTTFELKADKSTTYTKTEVDTSLGLKANKQQEAWITPTLTNGYVSSETEPVRYRKNEFGVVEWRGRLIATNATGQGFAIIPSTHRPIATVLFPLTTPTINNFGQGYVSASSGSCGITNWPTKPAYFDLSLLRYCTI